jgi:hypothetical protein
MPESFLQEEEKRNMPESIVVGIDIANTASRLPWAWAGAPRLSPTTTAANKPCSPNWQDKPLT